MMKRSLKNQGFTLVELMIALGILGLVMTLITSVFSAQQRAYFAVDEIAEAQQHSHIVKTVMDLELRHAGFMVPVHGAFCAIDSASEANARANHVNDLAVLPGTDVLFISASGTDVIDPISVLVAPVPDRSEALENDLGARVTGITGGTLLTLESTSIDFSPSATDTDFQVGQGVILVSEHGDRPLACGKITGAPGLLAPGTEVPAGANKQVTVFWYYLGSVAALPGEDRILIPAHLYEVGNEGSSVPILFRNSIAFVPGVEDFQVGLFVDQNGDRKEDIGEYIGIDAGDGSFDFSLVDVTNVREVQVGYSTRSASVQNAAVGATTMLGIAQTVLNHDPLTDSPAAEPDGFRRRVVTTTAWLRNVSER